jgi:hypothetical protein
MGVGRWRAPATASATSAATTPITRTSAATGPAVGLRIAPELEVFDQDSATQTA